MTKTNRYDVSDLIEAQYQQGSRGRVLRNLPGITGKRMMDEARGKGAETCVAGQNKGAGSIFFARAGIINIVANAETQNMHQYFMIQGG